MPRRGRYERHPLLPDARYNSLLISRFVNKLMMRGKKGLAESILYNTIDELEKRAKRPGLEVFEQAIRNATPVIEVKPRRVGGATYQVPVEIKGDRRQSLAIRWVLSAARKRTGKSMVDRLAAELMDASNNVGTTIKKREDTHRMAEANRAFAHYRF
ncbi:MAG TPA: 30S ribosomal protein S7 [Chloroflexia bacterium]|nr:30S ribosomal protein S7 [Chloroflexia bacterium]